MSSAQLEMHPTQPENFGPDQYAPDPYVHDPSSPSPLHPSGLHAASLHAASLHSAQPERAPFTLQPAALQQQAAERIAAHRARRQKTPAPAVPRTSAPTPSHARASRIAATVAERYAHSQSYRSFLAAEAESAIRQAQAAADVAALNARAVADAQYSLLAELDQFAPPPPPDQPAAVEAQSAALAPAPAATPTVSIYRDQAPAPRASQSLNAGVTIRPFEDLAGASTDLATSFTNSELSLPLDPLDEEGLALDDEIAFRQSPVFEPSIAPIELPANLIEFPRQLVAARRARPRLAEGPLREDPHTSSDPAQLRIFEVESAQIDTAPTLTPEPDPAPTEWSSLLLDAHPVSIPHEPFRATTYTPHYAPNSAFDYAPESLEAQLTPAAPQHIATVNLRLMAAAVDCCLILAAFLSFATVAALTAGTLSIGLSNLPAIGLAAAASLLLLTILYQLLFFSLTDATPGMRYARIGLCTFTDENPSRSALRRRLLALALSACPLGIGLLWAWLDTDRLAWHDRLTRIYQRSY